MTFGDRLRTDRARLGYSLRSLAAATGAFGDRAPYTPAEVARWHHAAHGPRGDVLARLARLSFDLSYLLTGCADHAHHLAPRDGLGLHVPLARLYDRTGTPWWPTPIVWTPQDALAAAQLHQRTSGGRRVLMHDVVEAASVRLAARARVSWASTPPDGATRRLAAIAARWLADFDLAAVTAQPVALESIVAQAVRVLDVAERRAA